MSKRKTNLVTKATEELTDGLRLHLTRITIPALEKAGVTVTPEIKQLLFGELRSAAMTGYSVATWIADTAKKEIGDALITFQFEKMKP